MATSSAERELKVSLKLRRIAQLAQEDPDRVLTTLAHHIDLDFLYEAFRQVRKDGAPGVDGVTAVQYERNLSANLQDLLDRFHSGSYFAPPVRRAYIPKEKGKRRPLGIPTFEDKLLQLAVAMILNAVYEQDFLDCSYGYRPNRSAHDALDALREGIRAFGGGWVLDVDLKSFFDHVDHQWLREFLDRRVRDGVLRRTIDKWLKAGILENHQLHYPREGTPQGGVVSPVVANIYLHAVIDLWFHQEIVPLLQGRAFLVRYADDLVMVFEQERDAHRVYEVLPKRLGRFGLSLNTEKSQLVRFFPSPRKGQDNGEAPPPPRTFDFLGFTHYWARPVKKKGRKQTQVTWVIKRKTMASRFRRALAAITEWCRGHRHLPISQQHETLTAKLRGHYQYYAIRGNSRSVYAFLRHVERAWRTWLDRRSQRRRMPWPRFRQLLQRWPLPRPAMLTKP